MKAVFKQIIDSLPLRDEDRKDLREKRGFSDLVIDTMRFKSCGPFIKHGPYQEPHIVGAADWKEEIFKALADHDNIVIPYFGPDGDIEHIRPHKFGIAGYPVRVYIPFPYLGVNHETMVIAESEYKALASCIMGVPAIGIPGIASFSGKRFNEISDLLGALKCKNVVICFDNEIKDNPKFDNFKIDFTSRYDTQYYAYVMSRRLQKAEFKTTIAVLNPDWMVNGKIDIDGVLASGIPHEEYKKIIEKSIEPWKYKESWKLPPAHRSYMERRIDKYFYEGPIEVVAGIYVTKNIKCEKPISNFTIDVVNTVFDNEGIAQRVCQFKSSYGNSKTIMLPADVMASKTIFNKFCIERGDYVFKGSEEDMKNIWKYIFMNQSGKIIRQIPYFGYDEETGAWFFENGAYHNDVFYKADDLGVVWISDIGFQVPESLGGMDPPALSSKENCPVTIAEILDHMGKIVGPARARTVLGWTLANFFMPEILAKYGIFPFFFLHGKMESGKSTIANWISSFFGLTQKGFSMHTSSVVGITRITSQFSMIPVWLEEYRSGDHEIARKNNFLRGVYDRSTILKGTKVANELKTYTARSTLIISGEETPKDAALNSRCFMFPLHRDSDGSSDTNKDFAWMQEHRSIFNQIPHWILTNKKTLWPKIEEAIGEYDTSFDENDIKIGSRNKAHMSIIAGVCRALVGADEEFDLHIGDLAELQQQSLYHGQALDVFLDDILNMQTNKKMACCVASKRQDPSGQNIICLAFSSAYSQWEIVYKGLRNDIPASKQALTNHIKKEPYYIDTRQAKISGNNLRCFILDYDSDKLPAPLKALADNYTENEYEPMAPANRNLFAVK